MPNITGLSNAQEQAFQERTVNKIARTSEAALRKEIERAMKSAVGLTTGELAAAKFQHERKIEEIMTSKYTRTWQLFGGRIVESAEKKELMSVPLAERFLAAMQAWLRSDGAEKITMIAGTTFDQASKIINDVNAQALADGVGEIQRAKMINDAISKEGGKLSKLRSRVISRTEVHAAANASSYSAAQVTGLPMNKEWVAAGGSRTREHHREANGQMRQLNEMFIVNGEEMRYPHDSSGSAENVINCRCTVVYSVG